MRILAVLGIEVTACVTILDRITRCPPPPPRPWSALTHRAGSAEIKHKARWFEADALALFVTVPKSFACAGYANQGRFPCIARRHRSIECLIRAVLLRCWKGLHCLSAAWHVRSVHGRLHVIKRFAASAVTYAISQLRTSSERKLSLLETRPPFTVEIGLLFVFSLSNSLIFVSFLRLSDLSIT